MKSFLHFASTPDESPGWKFWKRRRYVVAFMAFLGFFNVYALRANLSIAIVVMTENKPVLIGNDTVYVREFDWDSKLQGYVLSSFFYGYITTQLLGGWLAMKIGGQRLFGIGVGATAFMTLISPLVANISVYLFIALRVLEGIFEGVTYPCIHAVWSQWAPPLERSRLATFAFTGSYFGTVVSMPVCALLSEWLGWPSIFYVFGVVGVIWFVMWNVLLYERPTSDPKISKEELKYITESLGTTERKTVRHPWKSILTSVPVWAIIAANFSENWGFYTFLTQLPKYMKDILEFDIAHTGFMAALPYLVMSIMLLLSGHIADWFLVKKILTVTQVRKLFNCGAFISQSIFLIGASFATTATMGMICLIFAAGLGSFSLAGFSVNYLDIAPQHASVLMGIGNTIGSIPGIVSPILSGYVVTTPTRGEWQVVFFTSAGIYLTGCIIYGLFATGELQPWAEQAGTNLETKTEKSKNGIDNKAFQSN
ncbi:vesicular glutamate transporter 1-like isoform X2 [Coccinella septempunctata]|uniref:vesicular glutamate transporter 1-like isoform X2 n=1 Tax=Coccinella septempunctata TaxID=41139 RepID=UPI001D08FC1C|nr:vesicular glutamate transporter 1-like isoform X2 [Coccinella septempunctata]